MVAPATTTSLARAAEVGLAEIGDLSREPREAIIACYAAMERELTRVPGAAPQALILEPAVTGAVTVISAQPLTQAGVWDLYQSVLRVQGFAAVQAGAIWRVIAQPEVREAGGRLGDAAGSGQFDVVTRIVKLDHFPVATAVARSAAAAAAATASGAGSGG